MRFNESDYELLSAYIDEMLEEDERSALEARLQQEPELRRELSALRQTVALVRQLPPMRAPRDFSLTAEMVGLETRQRPQRGIIMLPLLSAAAAVMLMVIGAVLLLTTSGNMDTATAPNAAIMREFSDMTMTLQVDTAVAAAPTAAPTATVMVGAAEAEEPPVPADEVETDDTADEAFADDALPEEAPDADFAEEAESAEAAMPQATAAFSVAGTATALLDMMSTSIAPTATLLPGVGGGVAPSATPVTHDQEAMDEVGDTPPNDTARSEPAAPPQAAVAATTIARPTSVESTDGSGGEGGSGGGTGDNGATFLVVSTPTHTPTITPESTPTITATIPIICSPCPWEMVTPGMVTLSPLPPTPAQRLTSDSGDDLPLVPLLLIGGGGVLLLASGLWWWLRRS